MYRRVLPMIAAGDNSAAFAPVPDIVYRADSEDIDLANCSRQATLKAPVARTVHQYSYGSVHIAGHPGSSVTVL